MELTEQMLVYVCDQVLGTRMLQFNGQTIDFQSTLEAD